MPTLPFSTIKLSHHQLTEAEACPPGQLTRCSPHTLEHKAIIVPAAWRRGDSQAERRSGPLLLAAPEVQLFGTIEP
ncbi:hypothetical protein EYF80_062919 [Liparis tanakae]|uniref:Uncharacterized protein n=1 Tax=Liparis tanakae TaxID=230148 RepID=A0A4Z2EDL2_9TELE|nr:hypothetical protein EYF80_062919 [Liparis tanakae]